jgi:hypothetical protein
VAISAVGIISIPFGDPQFVDRATTLESLFIILAIVIIFDIRFSVKGVAIAKIALWACIPLAVLVIAGNSLAPPRIVFMASFPGLLNAILLMIGGYVLQVALFGIAIAHIVKMQQSIVKKGLDSFDGTGELIWSLIIMVFRI